MYLGWIYEFLYKHTLIKMSEEGQRQFFRSPSYISLNKCIYKDSPNSWHKMKWWPAFISAFSLQYFQLQENDNRQTLV